MNAITPIATPAELPRQAFTDATTRVNAWRGQCLDAFCRAEMAVTETLHILSQQPEHGGKVGLPHLIGQRYEALTAAIRADGPFAAEGAHALPAMEQFQSHSRLRTLLCHGVGRVTLDARGQWTLVLRSVSLRAKIMSRDLQVLTEAEGESQRLDVSRASQTLRTQLDKVRAGLLVKAG